MGQQVAVVEKPSSTRGLVRYEANHNLTGQGHERFMSAADAVGSRPAAELARRLFATGKVESVHMYSNMVTVNLLKGYGSEDLDLVVRDLYQYWQPGMEPSFEEPVAEAPAAAGGTAGGSGDGSAPSAYETLIPQVLRDRSAAALARWKARG